MKKIFALGLLVVLISALSVQDAHEQNRRRPANNYNPYTSQPNQTNRGPIQLKKVGFESVPGTPYGQETATKRTCFQSPCYAPNAPCQLPRKW